MFSGVWGLLTNLFTICRCFFLFSGPGFNYSNVAISRFIVRLYFQFLYHRMGSFVIAHWGQNCGGNFLFLTKTKKTQFNELLIKMISLCVKFVDILLKLFRPNISEFYFENYFLDNKFINRSQFTLFWMWTDYIYFIGPKITK